MRVHHQTFDTVWNWVLDSLSFFLPVCIILFKGLLVVEVVHNFLLVPLLHIRHEVDPPCEVTIVIVASLFFIAGSITILEIIHGLMTLAW